MFVKQCDQRRICDFGLLGYGEWRNVNSSAISKAKTACEVFGHLVTDEFVVVNKMVDLRSGSPLRIAAMVK